MLASPLLLTAIKQPYAMSTQDYIKPSELLKSKPTSLRTTKREEQPLLNASKKPHKMTQMTPLKRTSITYIDILIAHAINEKTFPREH